jgi:FRG domain
MTTSYNFPEVKVPISKDVPSIVEDEKSFYRFLECYATVNMHAIYRGIIEEEFELIPNIGRVKKGNTETENIDVFLEDRIFKQFKKSSRAYINYYCSDIELLAIGQHHGLPTRLLDWSFNPLVAIYFAVEKSHQNPENRLKNSAVYVYLFEKNCFIERITDPITEYIFEELKLFKPSFYNERIARQNGVFTIHNFPWKHLRHENLHKILIHHSFRRKLRKLLSRFGVDESSMYPGLDGISKHIRWTHTDHY